jgi:hypothetical protein
MEIDDNLQINMVLYLSKRLLYLRMYYVCFLILTFYRTVPT